MKMNDTRNQHIFPQHVVRVMDDDRYRFAKRDEEPVYTLSVDLVNGKEVSLFYAEQAMLDKDMKALVAACEAAAPRPVPVVAFGPAEVRHVDS